MPYDKGTSLADSGYNNGGTRGSDSAIMKAIEKANAAKQYYWIIQSSNEQLHEDVCNMLRNEVEPEDPDKDPGAGLTWNHSRDYSALIEQFSHKSYLGNNPPRGGYEGKSTKFLISEEGMEQLKQWKTVNPFRLFISG